MKRSMLATVVLLAGFCTRSVFAQEAGAAGVVLCEASVKIGSRTVKTLAPGDCVRVAEIRGDWAGVSGDSPGWIARCAVGTPEQAISRFSQAVCQEPKNAAVYAARGNARLAAGQISAAITDYETALRLNPDFAPVRRQLAVARPSWESKYRANGAPTASVADDNVIESFDIKCIGDLLVVPVTVGGQEYDFLLDTGSSGTVFDPSLKQWFKPTGRMISVNNGAAQLDLYECPDATIGRSKTPLGDGALCLDLAGFRDVGDIWGIVGMDMLKQVVLQLDFDAGKVRFLKSSVGAPGEKLPLTTDRLGLPTVEASLAGSSKASFMLDTGGFWYCDCCVSSSKFDDLESNALILRAPEIRCLTATGIDDWRVGTSERLALGPFEHATPVVYEAGGNYISLLYLSRYVVTMDFAGGAIFLQKGRQYGRRLFPDRSGLGLRIIDGALVVTKRVPSGWGHQCGLQENDRILEINGRETKGMILREAMLTMLNFPADLALKVRSGDAPARTIRVRPSDRHSR